MTDAASTEMASASEAPEPLASATSADDVVADISHSDYPALEGKTPPMVRTRQQTSGSLAAGTPGFVRVGTRTEVKVPSTPEGITAEWLTQVYRNRGFLRSDGEVKSVTLKPLGDGLGVAGDLCRVLIELSGAAMMDAPTRFVAKFTPREAGLISSVVLKFQFATEAHWYNDMLDDEQGLSRPAAFYVGAKLAHKRFWRIKPVVCMLFEEMPKPLYSVASGISELRHMELVVSMLATLHARWWQKPKKPPIEWVSHPSKDNFGLQLNAFIYAAKSGTAALRRCFPETFAPILAWAPLIKRRHNYLVKRLFTPPLTLCHGDVHLDNIFFDDSFPGGLKMIDFGNMFIGQGGNDVAFFLGTNLDPAVRRQHEQALVRRYHAGLVEGGVNATEYPFERCWEDYRFNLWRAYINVGYVASTRFDAMKKSRSGIFAASPSEADRKELATHSARNSRLVAALVDLKFDELIEEGPATCGPCSCCPFCA